MNNEREQWIINNVISCQIKLNYTVNKRHSKLKNFHFDVINKWHLYTSLNMVREITTKKHEAKYFSEHVKVLSEASRYSNVKIFVSDLSVASRASYHLWP